MNNNTTSNIDFTDALSQMITPNNQPPTQFKQKKPPAKKTTKPKTNKTTKSSNKQNNNNNKQTSNKNNQTTKTKSQPKKKSSKQITQPNNQPNQPTQKIPVKSKQQSQKDFKKAQLESNKKLSINVFKGVLDNINEEKQENNLPIMTLPRFTSITNSLMKIFNDSNYLIQDTDNIYDLLTDKMDMITNTIKDKSVNTQRKIITDIITILNSNPNTQLKDIRKYEYYRKKLQLDKLKDKVNQSKQIDNQDNQDYQPNQNQS